MKKIFENYLMQRIFWPYVYVLFLKNFELWVFMNFLQLYLKYFVNQIIDSIMNHT